MSGKAWEQVSFKAAADKVPTELDFCVPNLLAGGVGTVATDAGIGKTSLLLQFAAAVAAGIAVAGEALPACRRTALTALRA